MFQRLWQSGMIALARSKRIKSFVQTRRGLSKLAGRYVIGETPEDAVGRAAAMLEAEGFRASLFHLGEYVDTPDLVAENVAAKAAVTDALAGTRLDVHVSVDPTQIGQVVDAGTMAENARVLARRITAAADGRPGVNLMMVDMEDDTLVDSTIALHDALRDEGFATALTLQAYLRRTGKDLEAQIAKGGKVRLVKGAFVAASDIAFTTRAEIKANTRRLIDRMFSAEARANGFYPIIATHDDAIQDHAIARATANGWGRDAWEFEMLLGVRPELARRRVGEGCRVRLYMPFGRDWWPYAIRRIGESPANAAFVFRSLFAGG